MKENNLQQLYLSAIGFYRSGLDAALKIKNSRGNEALIVVPIAATNLSFSAELFLKLLYFMKTKNTELRLHKLSDIFDELPVKITSEIKRKYEHSKEDENHELVPVRYSLNTTFGNENDFIMQNKKKLIILFLFFYFGFSGCLLSQNRIRHNLITINYSHLQNISANSFFQNKMTVEKDYKVAGRKFEIFFEKDNNVFCGKKLSASKEIKVDTLYTISKDSLMMTFPDYHLEGYQVKNIVYAYLKDNIPGYGILDGKNKFKYKIDKSLIKIVYEQITHKYIKRKSTKYYFILDSKNLNIVDFKKL